jgi:hypothetical protein
MDFLSKNKAKISDLLSETLTLVQNRYSQSAQLFTVASVWGQIIFVLENLVQLVLFFIEDSISELNINQATREASVYGLAALAGHTATRAISAKGEIEIRWNGKNLDDVRGGAILLPNYSELKCLNNGASYIVKLNSDYVRINLNQNSVVTASIIEGSRKTQQFTGTGRFLQSYNISSRGTSNIENFEVEVLVNGREWKRYDSLYDMPRNSAGFIVKNSLISGIDIFFGNFNFGAAPQLGSTIEVNYIESTGSSGNVNVSDAFLALMEFTSDGTDLFGNTLTLKDVLAVQCSIAPQLGASQEPIDLTRILAPKTSRSFVLANPDNYITFFEKFGAFSIIEAFTTFNDNYLDDDNIIYLILVPDINQKLKSNETYFDIALSEFKLTNSQRSSILNLLNESGQMVVTTEVKILDPIISRYVVNIVLTMFEGYDPETIKSEIVSLLSDYFLSIRRRDKIPRSDLIAIIENVAGVDSVSLYFVGENNEKTKKENPESDEIGFDEFGDIIMEKNEIVIISGGWEDRNTIYYDLGADMNKLSSVNIDIRRIVPQTYNTQVNQINKNALKNK